MDQTGQGCQYKAQFPLLQLWHNKGYQNTQKTKGPMVHDLKAQVYGGCE